jgi:hypothetical protein
MPKVREPGIPGLEDVARRIREEVGIPPFPDRPDPVTGRYRPTGWYMVRRDGKRVVPVDRGQIVKRKKGPMEFFFGERRRSA